MRKVSTFWERLKWLFKGGDIPNVDTIPPMPQVKEPKIEEPKQETYMDDGFPVKHLTVHTSYHDTIQLVATYHADWDSAWESSDEVQKIIVQHLKEEIYERAAPFIEIDTVQDVPNMSVVYRARLRIVDSKGY